MSQVSGATTGSGGLGSGYETSTVQREDDKPSIGELFSSVTEDISLLVRQEVALAKAEATQSAKKAGKGAGMLAGAAVAGHFVLLFLSVALWWGLGTALDNRGWSAVIVAVIWGIVAAILASVGRKALKQVEGLPQTADTVKKAPNALKGQEEMNR